MIRVLQQFIFPIILVSIVFSTLVQSYDEALSNDFIEKYRHMAAINFEVQGLLKAMKNLPSLHTIDFQMSEGLFIELEKGKTQWRGFVQTLKNYIHQERRVSDQGIEAISERV